MKIKNRILFIVNPISGNFDKSNIKKLVEKNCEEKGIDLHIYTTTGNNDPKKISEFLKNNNPDRILIAGGDGTIQMVADIIEDGEILGILPAGSANGLATNFNLPEDRQEQIEIAMGNNFLKMDTLKLNGDTCLHIADLGMNAELIEKYERSQIRGKFGYLLQSIPTLLKCEYPFEFEIETEEKTIETQGILLAIANAQKFGTGANINPDGKLNDGKMELLIFKNLDFIEIFKTLNNNTTLNPDFVEVIKTTKATIRCKTEVAFQIDGEYKGKVQKVIAEMADKKLNIAVPADFNQ